MSAYAPRIITIKIPVDKIRDVIGPGGKMIRSIIEKTGVKIDVEDDGQVNVASADEAAASKAIGMIQELTATAELNKTYLGKVQRITDFGAFVEIMAGTDGLLHVSEIAHYRVKDVRDELKEGQQVLVKVINIDPTGKLLADGYAPIVFCRFIHTAEYVAEHLKASLGTARSPVHVEAVTGQLPPAERERRVQELARRDGARVLVATDCLSEGVNLQEDFSAVVHYDLAWNPTRHEQREGRVDRFGQRRDVVRALTLYGDDNGIDGIVLDVLIRKHRAIAKATGVAVPVPGDGRRGHRRTR